VNCDTCKVKIEALKLKGMVAPGSHLERECRIIDCPYIEVEEVEDEDEDET